MSGSDAHFSVNTRLTRLLGETYRSSEAALKELVDNAWDADAKNVWIDLPSPMTSEAIVVRDDGAGMTSLEMQNEYLNIASDKRARTGERTPSLKRKVKGRKGIGKFAGLSLANRMDVIAVARARKCHLSIDKMALTENENDLESVPLPFLEEEAASDEVGTTIVLSDLDSRLNFPTADRFRELLVHEYGREDSFKVFVNDDQLSVEDVPGVSKQVEEVLAESGAVRLRFTIADGKKAPKSPGIVLKVDGKVVGKPMLFGLDDDEEIPLKLSKRVFGEVELDGNDHFVTADWGGVIENSKAFQEIQAYVRSIVKQGLQETHARDMSLQLARLKRQIDLRLQQLPEHRRRYAEEALNRILRRFYGESEDRISTIAEVALDAIEHDAYWAVLERINMTSRGDVGSFAEALEQFGLVELSAIAAQAARRLQFLDFLDELIQNEATLEQNMHQALETNLWVLGRQYATMASNTTLKRIIAKYGNAKFSGDRASKRPDLLLSQDLGDSFLIIEFKRPSHPISRDDIAQAEKYRDDLATTVTSKSPLKILMIGKGRADSMDARYAPDAITISSYVSLVSAARTELNWLMTSLAR
ncbi:ATP-binding protein [Rhizobium laguerreae]|uniref:ATP-binding protein n=1 Tax=Rhizobium laguerreae TaxID=1076926 RepID=UPI001C91F079|nr:ATP-binding protein [Rhizobium laguerreae]MBY3228754.1 ATP-binding protein [Rhizobium laguerreae]MBY3560721.1 ATP-binding protein [Rhizobium laguerreae]